LSCCCGAQPSFFGFPILNRKVTKNICNLEKTVDRDGWNSY
jgi:hypothetical protein